MTITHPANIDIEAALAEAEEHYRARNPKSLAQHREACAAMPGGNTRSAIHVDPFPLTIARGEGARLWDIDGHEYVDFLSEFTAGILRPFAPGDPQGDRGGARRRPQFRRAQCDRGAVRRGDLRPLPVDRAGALHQFRHRGQSDGGQRGAGDHRPAEDPGVRRRLSWRRVLFPRPWQRAQRAVRVSARAIQRPRRGRGAGPAAPSRARRDPDRADAGHHRLHPGRAARFSPGCAHWRARPGRC